MTEIIDIPPFDAASSLDGISLMSIDTDPDSNLVLALNGLTTDLPGKPRVDILAVVPLPAAARRRGYLLVIYDPAKANREKS